ncbi:MAG TPA: aromatic ring-hydroxylating dioxygenase subunit alpha [Gammaproteobacteria bacterium]|nr:aromatic ring-hydroxylating dioxygenase subunit alpha [Gammaproteobacteria bacterium]HIL97812.1 aromatic ring-hydroxylating dioxygenase subunit alpha [Pseudomonadales bacterium]
MARNIYQKSESDLKPGEARCPGPNVQDVLISDADNPPQALREQRYEFLGDQDIAYSRYTSQAFFDLEMEQLWTKTWQWACRVEQIPGTGDYSVYDIGKFSVIVIRGDDNVIRAFINSCPHRGMQFCDAGSTGTGKQFLRCPFHGMSWHLDGSLREIPCRWDFPHIDEANFRLTEIPCDTWAGFVFINLDRKAEPLIDYLEVLPEHFADWNLENRYITLHTAKVLPGNWKMCMEGFLEAYHVLGTHPEALHSSSWANTQYDMFSPHVSRFFQNLSSGNPQFEREVSQPELFRLLGNDPESLPDGMSARQCHADRLRQKLGTQMQVDLSKTSNSEMLDSIEYHLFPNACFFPGIVIPLIYRFRPLGVDKCIHDIMLLQPVPDNGPRPEPAATVHLDIDDPYTSVPAFKENRLAHVLDQDTDNFKRQWAGILASLKGSETLGNYQEARIRHFHNTLDNYLEGRPDDTNR